MKTKVVYYTKSGNTEKIANAIGEALGAEVSNMDNHLSEPVDVLFLGASVCKFGIDKKVLDYINHLNADEIRGVVIFRHQLCLIANKNRPNSDDVNEAKKFAESIVKN